MAQNMWAFGHRERRTVLDGLYLLTETHMRVNGTTEKPMGWVFISMPMGHAMKVSG
jgi:hypothetical protein